jgi:hypothetical protein
MRPRRGDYVDVKCYRTTGVTTLHPRPIDEALEGPIILRGAVVATTDEGAYVDLRDGAAVHRMFAGWQAISPAPEAESQ